MSTEVRVPTLGESVTEATVATWFKKPGDAVAIDEMLCELETDKVTVEVPSPVAGTLSEIVAAEGETVGVDALLAQVSEGDAPAKSDGGSDAALALRRFRAEPGGFDAGGLIIPVSPAEGGRGRRTDGRMDASERRRRAIHRSIRFFHDATARCGKAVTSADGSFLLGRGSRRGLRALAFIRIARRSPRRRGFAARHRGSFCPAFERVPEDIPADQAQKNDRPQPAHCETLYLARAITSPPTTPRAVALAPRRSSPRRRHGVRLAR